MDCGWVSPWKYGHSEEPSNREDGTSGEGEREEGECTHILRIFYEVVDPIDPSNI